MIEALLLDYGHTIVDFVTDQRALLAAYQEIVVLLADEAGRQAVDAAPALADLSQQIVTAAGREGLDEVAILQAATHVLAAVGLPLPPDLAQRVLQLQQRALRAETYLPPDNAQALRALRTQGFRLALVADSGVPGETLRGDLDALALIDLFDVVLLSSETGHRKPQVAVYRTALATLGLRAGAALYVGDRLREDIEGPQAAGMRAVLTAQFRRELVGPGTPQPHAHIECLTDLPAAARQLQEARA